MIKGVYTALITPFLKNYQVDYNSLENLLEIQNQSQVNGVVLLGTTAEECTLSNDECLKIIQLASKILTDKKIYVGISGNCTQTMISKLKLYDKYNIDGYLIGSPYYNKPTPNGLVKHFSKIAKSTKKSIILYNIPSRCGISLDFYTLNKLKPIKNIIAIKEASGNIDYFTKLIASFSDRYNILCGNDNMFLPMLCSGAVGCISVLSNYLPQFPVKIYENYVKNIKKCIFLHNKFNFFASILFTETNPSCIKYVLSKDNLCKNILRSPLCGIKRSTKQKINSAIEDLKNNVKLIT